MKQKYKDLAEKDDAVLKEELAARQKHLFDLRTQAEKPSDVSRARRDIARIKTLLRQRQLTASK